MTEQPLSSFLLSGVSAEHALFKEKQSILVKMPSASYQDAKTDKLTDRPLFAWLPVAFRNGVIEVDVASVLAPDAPDFARGFIGVAFRIDSNVNFESIYLRPVNSRVDDQVRRNHSTQYFSYPDYDFARLRQAAPEKYESYVDIAVEEWIHMKIVVCDERAKLYVNHNSQPALVVNDLKLGPHQTGGVGLWIETGTLGYFSSLKIVDDEQS